jgi:hypothetical protein
MLFASIYRKTATVSKRSQASAATTAGGVGTGRRPPSLTPARKT